ncbi:MAG: MotA/TolQ/ExbB proton channel family protein [Chlamydiales bacterium]
MILSNPLINSYFQSDLFGKFIFFTLLLLSILTWIIFLKKLFLHKALKQGGARFQDLFQKKSINPLSFEVAEEIPLFADLYRTLKHSTTELLNKNQKVLLSHSDIEQLEAHMMNRVSGQVKELEKNLFVLSTTYTLAPFLGLLGTVWGILLTFNEMQTNIALNANSTVLGGLAMALGTTVLGLLVAIPALITYNYLKSSIANLSGDLEDFSYLLLTSIELHYRQIDIQ